MSIQKSRPLSAFLICASALCFQFGTAIGVGGYVELATVGLESSLGYLWLGGGLFVLSLVLAWCFFLSLPDSTRDDV